MCPFLAWKGPDKAPALKSIYRSQPEACSRVRVWGNQAIGLPLQRPLQGHTFSFRPRAQFSLNWKPPTWAHKTTELRNPKSSLNQNFLCPRGPVGIFLMHNLPLWHFPGPSPRPGANHQSCLSVNVADMLIYHPRSPQNYSYKATLVVRAVCALARVRAGWVFFLFQGIFKPGRGDWLSQLRHLIIGNISFNV